MLKALAFCQVKVAKYTAVKYFQPKKALSVFVLFKPPMNPLYRCWNWGSVTTQSLWDQ